jgi:TRAP-type uncharacterized transport system fused permease subunit
MSDRQRVTAITVLGWILGIVVLLESLHFAFSQATMREFVHSGLPGWIRPALGGSEAIAALLFLVPATRRTGGYALLAIFALAIVIHFLHGQFRVGGLFVYGAAVVVCLADERRRPEENGT